MKAKLSAPEVSGFALPRNAQREKAHDCHMNNAQDVNIFATLILLFVVSEECRKSWSSSDTASDCSTYDHPTRSVPSIIQQVDMIAAA